MDVMPPERYHQGNRELQDRFDTRRLADRIDQLLVHDTVEPHDAAFIERLDMFFLATADEQGRPNCSYKGGEPGFVRVVDEHTLAYPNYDGNGMYLSLGNVVQNPEVGLLFIDFERGHRMRVNGTASLSYDDELLPEWPGAQFVVRIHVREVFPNCPRYIHRYQLVRRSTFVPRPDRETPVPAWKRAGWAADALPAGDPACDPTRAVLDR
jgi:predicted pyridoxine 5'-phosphate oxidase superfamily flavin-nucleotide-binding protein